MQPSRDLAWRRGTSLTGALHRSVDDDVEHSWLAGGNGTIDCGLNLLRIDETLSVHPHAIGNARHIEGRREFGVRKRGAGQDGGVENLPLIDIEIDLQHPVHPVVTDHEDTWDVVIGRCPQALDSHHRAAIANDPKDWAVWVSALRAHGRPNACPNRLPPG